MTMAIYVLAAALAGCGLVYADRNGCGGCLGVALLCLVGWAALVVLL